MLNMVEKLHLVDKGDDAPDLTSSITSQPQGKPQRATSCL